MSSSKQAYTKQAYESIPFFKQIIESEIFITAFDRIEKLRALIFHCFVFEFKKKHSKIDWFLLGYPIEMWSISIIFVCAAIHLTITAPSNTVRFCDLKIC